MTKKKAMTFALIGMGFVIIVFFGMRVFHAFRKFNGHRPPPSGNVETDVELVRDWMTVPFISNMYHVHDRAIFEALDISPFANKDKSLKDINKEYFSDQDGHVLDLVKKTILTEQTAHPPKPDPESTKIPPPAATATP